MHDGSTLRGSGARWRQIRRPGRRAAPLLLVFVVRATALAEPGASEALIARGAYVARLGAAQCGMRHGEHGEGLRQPNGQLVFPALWGDGAFNRLGRTARAHPRRGGAIKRNLVRETNLSKT